MLSNCSTKNSGCGTISRAVDFNEWKDGNNLTKKISLYDFLLYAGFKHPDWLLNIFQPIRMLKKHNVLFLDWAQQRQNLVDLNSVTRLLD